MGKPYRPMMVVVRSTWMAHARQALTARSQDRKEERTGVISPKMPTRDSPIIDTEREL
jgi:hypothetical protein